MQCEFIPRGGDARTPRRPRAAGARGPRAGAARARGSPDRRSAMLRWHSLHLLSFSLSLSLGSLLFIADAEQAATRVAGSSQLVRVFVIPHTHDDPGWQQTIDEYVENYRAGSFMWRRL